MKRKVDSKARIVLPSDFIGSQVSIERISENEVRIRKHNPVKRFSLKFLLEGITEDNLHKEIDFSGPVGKEMM